jgi:hypothetical protein
VTVDELILALQALSPEQRALPACFPSPEWDALEIGTAREATRFTFNTSKRRVLLLCSTDVAPTRGEPCRV